MAVSVGKSGWSGDCRHLLLTIASMSLAHYWEAFSLSRSFFVGGQQGRTPLNVAAKRGHEDVVRLLLDSKAGVDTANQVGIVPKLCIHRFVFCSQIENAVSLLHQSH